MSSLPDGRQFLQVYDLPLPVPKGDHKYYHVSLALHDRESSAKAILHNHKRRMIIDGSGCIESVFILMDKADLPTVTAGAIRSVEVLGELSQAELESVTDGVKKVLASSP